MRHMLLAAGVTLLMVAVPGCTVSAPGDKTGGDTVVLRLATIDAVDNNGQSYGPAEFVRALEETSGGQLQVEVDTQTYGDGAVTAESELLTAIAEGEVDGGWPATRAFAAAGFAGLQVTEAPMTLTSYEAVRELVTSDVAELLLSRLDDTGVVGLGLAVGPLRRPFSSGRPLLGVGDWEGQQIRSFNSPTQDATIRALGAVPVHIGEAWPDAARIGTIDGLEFDVAQYHHNGMSTQAGHLTSNVVLWPKIFVLSLSNETYESLNREQQGWVQDAADRAVAASVAAEYDEESLVEELCAAGLELHSARPRHVAELRKSVAPVLEELRGDPAWPPIAAIAAHHPRPEAFEPAECVPAPRVRRVRSLAVPATSSDLPEGVYRNEVTVEDLTALGLGAAATEGFTGVWTLTVDDGRFSIDCRPLAESTGVDCNYTERLGPDFDANPREVGTLHGVGGRVWFQHETSSEHRLTDCTLPPSEHGETSCLWGFVHRLDWSWANGQLTMRNLTSTSPSYMLVVDPWERIN